MFPDAWMTSLHGCLSGNLESHPGKKLIDHLMGSASLALSIIEKHSLMEHGESILNSIHTHDLGKARVEFQKHLYGGANAPHSEISSFFTLSAAEKKDILNALLSAEAVRRHHTSIENWDYICRFWENQNEGKIAEQIRAVLPKWPHDTATQTLEDLKNELWDIVPDEKSIEKLWIKLRTILSVLVAADRMNAIGISEIPIQNLPEFKEKTFNIRNDMDGWRTETASKCFEKISKVKVPGIFTLTLPTGAGKTNIGLKGAHSIAKNLGYETIIYTLPFISVVEQNADFAREVFGEDNVQEDHSMACFNDVQEKTQEPDTSVNNYNLEKMGTLFRYWGCSIVVTTMVQLWETIFHPKANATIDFHRLSRAVVLMDEPQGIESRLWFGFGKMLQFIHEQYGTIFILMTATQPEIINGEELAPTVEFPFRRHKYKFLQEQYRLDQLSDILMQHTPFKKSSGLVVLNTRLSAYEAYKILRPVLDAPVYFLSRWMTPIHRRKVLQEVSEMRKNNQRCYLVSTQVVEAGVDLDFDWVFRDMGPFDSIIQVAGRCNRSALRDEGVVVIATLVSESNNSSFSAQVYDAVLLDKTRRILSEKPEFHDGEVANIVKQYYAMVTQSIKPSKVWENIELGNWGKEDYIPLFKENNRDIKVYIDDSGKIDEVLSQIRNMQRTLDNIDKIKNLQNQLELHAIGVSKQQLSKWLGNAEFVFEEEEMLESDDAYCIIRPKGVGEGENFIYDLNVGFQPKDSNTF